MTRAAQDDPRAPLPDLPDVDPLTRLLLRMAHRLGTPAEYTLLCEHAELLSRMLAPVAPAIAGGRTDLEFGLSDRLELKINVIAKGTTPSTDALPLVAAHPMLKELVGLIARHRLTFQYGIRIAPGIADIRVYPNEPVDGHLARGLFRDYRVHEADCIPPFRGYGLTSGGTLSLYAWSKDPAIRERMTAQTGIRFEQGFRSVLLWEQARFSPEAGWQRGKEAVQPHPFPLWMIVRAVKAMQLPHFTYFVSQPGVRNYGYLAGEQQYLSLYAPLRWG